MYANITWRPILANMLPIIKKKHQLQSLQLWLTFTCVYCPVSSLTCHSQEHAEPRLKKGSQFFPPPGHDTVYFFSISTYYPQSKMFVSTFQLIQRRSTSCWRISIYFRYRSHFLQACWCYTDSLPVVVHLRYTQVQCQIHILATHPCVIWIILSMTPTTRCIAFANIKSARSFFSFTSTRVKCMASDVSSRGSNAARYRWHTLQNRQSGILHHAHGSLWYLTKRINFELISIVWA